MDIFGTRDYTNKSSTLTGKTKKLYDLFCSSGFSGFSFAGNPFSKMYKGLINLQDVLNGDLMTGKTGTRENNFEESLIKNIKELEGAEISIDPSTTFVLGDNSNIFMEIENLRVYARELQGDIVSAIGKNTPIVRIKKSTFAEFIYNTNQIDIDWVGANPWTFHFESESMPPPVESRNRGDTQMDFYPCKDTATFEVEISPTKKFTPAWENKYNRAHMFGEFRSWNSFDPNGDPEKIYGFYDELEYSRLEDNSCGYNYPYPGVSRPDSVIGGQICAYTPKYGNISDVKYKQVKATREFPMFGSYSFDQAGPGGMASPEGYPYGENPYSINPYGATDGTRYKCSLKSTRFRDEYCYLDPDDDRYVWVDMSKIIDFRFSCVASDTEHTHVSAHTIIGPVLNGVVLQKKSGGEGDGGVKIEFKKSPDDLIIDFFGEEVSIPLTNVTINSNTQNSGRYVRTTTSENQDPTTYPISSYHVTANPIGTGTLIFNTKALGFSGSPKIKISKLSGF